MIDPDTGLWPVHIDLWHDDRWNDITCDVDVSDGIRVNRGRSDYQSSASPSQCTFTLINDDGKYSPKNPLSPLYNKVGRNTPVRLRVGEPETSIRLYGDSTSARPSYVHGDYDPQLDIPGTMDLRIDMTPDTWWPETYRTVVGRLGPGTNGFLWYLRQDPSRGLAFIWHTPSGYHFHALPDSATLGPGRTTVRIVSDPSAEEGVDRCTWYLGESVDGPWSLLGETETPNPNDDEHMPGGAPLTIGAAWDGGSGYSDGEPYAGHIHGLRLLDGDDGDAAADITPDQISGPYPGSGFTDRAGIRWTVSGTTAVRDYSGATRFVGYVNAWPPRWSDPDNIRVGITAYGYRQLVDRSSTPTRSPMYRANGSPAMRDRLLGYWPMEEGEEAGAFASGIGGQSMIVGRIPGYHVRDIEFAAYDGFRASDAIPEFRQTAAVGQVPNVESSGELSLVALVHPSADWPKVDGDNVEYPGYMRWFRFQTTGDVAQWDVGLRGKEAGNNAGNPYVAAFDRRGTKVMDVGVSRDLYGENLLVFFRLKQNGPAVDWELYYQMVDRDTGNVIGSLRHPETWDPVPGTVGSATSVTVNPTSGLDGTAIGHVSIANRDVYPAEWFDAVDGHHGESAVDRTIRLADEEKLTLTVLGDRGDSEPLGFQDFGTVSQLLEESVEADLGSLYDSRESLSLEYRTRSSVYNQTPVVIDYKGDPVIAPFEPTDDDDLIENDVTVTRREGATFRAIQDSGPLSASVPPEGIGRYEANYTLSLADDSQVSRQAHWRLHMGTVDEVRYPTVSLALHDKPEIADEIRRLDILDRLQVTSLPNQLPPDRADVVIQGIEEYLDGIEWVWTANGTPASTWQVGVSDDPVYGRADTAGSELIGSASETKDTLAVVTTNGPRWVEAPNQFPFDVELGGEIVTVTGIQSLLSDDFGRGDVGRWGIDTWDESLTWGE